MIIVLGVAMVAVSVVVLTATMALSQRPDGPRWIHSDLGLCIEALFIGIFTGGWACGLTFVLDDGGTAFTALHGALSAAVVGIAVVAWWFVRRWSRRSVPAGAGGFGPSTGGASPDRPRTTPGAGGPRHKRAA